MTSRNLFAIVGTLALAVPCASASVETRQVTITNDTAVPFARIVFYFMPDVLADAPRFNAIRFADDLSLQSSPQNPVNKLILDAPTNDRLSFDYTNFTPLAPGGSYAFSLTVDNPFDEPFTFGWRIFFGNNIPSPAGLALVALPALAALRRRR